MANTAPKNKLLCSTGAFIGRVNGLDHRHIIAYAPLIEADGFEVMFFNSWYNNLDVVIRDLSHSGISFDCLHTDKRIGELYSNNISEDILQADLLLATNCKFAQDLGVPKIVLHLWGAPKSDTYIKAVLAHAPTVLQIVKAHNLQLYIENVPCATGNPLEYFEVLGNAYGYAIDTRFLSFHGSLEQHKSSSIWSSNTVRHIHISDHNGSVGDWKSLRPILHPDEGVVDFNDFFYFLKLQQYSGHYTLESPVMSEQGVDIIKLNNSLNNIRKNL